MVTPRKRRFQAREVRNTITVNSAIAATRISDPTIGAATKAFPFNSTTATPAGNGIAPIIWSQPRTLARLVVPAAGISRSCQAEQEQEDAADQVEMGVRGRGLKAVRESRSSRPVPVFVT